MPLPVWLPSWLTNLLGGGWIRSALGIRKDLIDTKKAKLEVRKLQDEERARNLITPATMDDVKRYDPKVALLEARISEIASTAKDYARVTKPNFLVQIILWSTLLALLYRFIKWLSRR